MTIELKAETRQVGAITHIKQTSLRFGSGHFNVLLGETGAGKTSLIKLMAGLDPCASGSILMDGKNVTHPSPQASPLKIAGMSPSEIDDRVDEAARLLLRAPMPDGRPQELSGGQQQRTAPARAIAKESRAVFLDEPLADLGYKPREEGPADRRIVPRSGFPPMSPGNLADRQR